MDTPENNTPETTNERNTKVSLEGEDIKTDSVIQDYNEVTNSRSYEHSDKLFNITAQTPVKFENQLIINEEMADEDQSNVHSESVEFINENILSANTSSEQQEEGGEIPLIHENLSDSVEQVIVTTLSEVIACENDSIITATCTTQLDPEPIKIETQTHSVLEDSNLKIKSEQNISIKEEESFVNSSNSDLDQSLPSFIGEVDESVSMPPAEPLILEHENIPLESVIESVSANDEEIVTEDISLTEIVQGNSIENELIADNSVENEIVTENSIETVAENEISTENEVLSENRIENVTDTPNTTLNEITVENATVDEIKLAGAPKPEIITSSESNVQYTVLPPGENSVYQEDGTLVVEYPLDTTEIDQSESINVNEFIESHKLDTVDSVSSEQLIEPDKNLVRDEENVIEMVEAISEDGSISTDAGTSSQKKESVGNEKNVVAVKPQPKPRGRKSTVGIPPHIVGHTIDKPIQDVPNGKGLKPRLGVKIPYKKLASQIVSTSELQNHIIERARIKEEARFESEQTNQFTKKLTHRLAQSLSGRSKIQQSSLAPEKGTPDDIQIIENILAVIPTNEGSTELQPTNPIEFVEHVVNEETVVTESTVDKVGETEVSVPSTECIENAEIIFADNANNPTNIESNSDLIAILEGDGEETSSIMNVPNVIEIVDTSENASEIKAIEKEISLSEQKISNSVAPPVKEKKFFKSGESRVSDISKDKSKDVSRDISKDKSKESIAKPKSTLITFGSNTKILSVKKAATVKANIFDSESASVSRGIAQNAETKKHPQEKTSDTKGKSSGFIVEVEPQLKPAMVLKTYTRKRKSNDVSTPEPPKKPLIMSPSTNQPDPKIDCVTPVPPNVYVTKSSRVIKKKVIWDPDEAMPTVRNQTKILSKIEATVKATTPSKVTTQKPVVVKTTEKKVGEPKQTENPKITRAIEKKVGKTIPDEKEKKAVNDKNVVKKPEKPEVAKKINAKNNVAERTTPQNKVIITSSLKLVSPGKSPKRSFKRLTEIDKLLMDEGAVNMLYDINNSDDQKRRVSGRIAVAPADKTLNQKELLNRTQEIKNELTQGTSIDTSTPKTLRKKDGPPSVKKEASVSAPAVTRKLSKDSTKSSVHSPPPSPANFTPAEASRIIRRHSSSSFSSNDGVVHDESMDTAVEKEKEKHTKKKEVPVEDVQMSSSNIDSNPVTESGKGKGIKKKASVTPEATPKKKQKLKQEGTVVANGEPLRPTEIAIRSEPGVVTGVLKTDPTKAFTVIKMNKHYMINLAYSGGDNYLTGQLLKDLTVTLKELERTRNCSVVSINSQGPAFCLGIDYKELVESDGELRDKKQEEMSNCIRDFLKCLLNFSKIIVAGVKGDCIGFGVTMLPLFDMIVATDTASFCTPYAKIGCPPEAGFLLSIPYQSNHGLASELLYTAQRMNADEAQRRGLVTKLFWPEKFDSEFRGLLSHISNLSKTALMMTKKQLGRVRYETTEMEINNNCKLLVKFWSSEECQNAFVNYNALTFDIDH